MQLFETEFLLPIRKIALFTDEKMQNGDNVRKFKLFTDGLP